MVNNLKQSEYNIEKIVTESLDMEVLRVRHKHLLEDIPSLENRKKYLELERTTLETKISMHNQVLSKYHFLETLGFGLNQLQFLWTTVNEIARENNIPPKEAVTKFFSDVERQYNTFGPNDYHPGLANTELLKVSLISAKAKVILKRF